jgi:hypothetical protein
MATYQRPDALTTRLINPRRWKRETGKFFGVDDTASDEELRRRAPDHPVFRIA